MRCDAMRWREILHKEKEKKRKERWQHGKDQIPVLGSTYQLVVVSGWDYVPGVPKFHHAEALPKFTKVHGFRTGGQSRQTQYTENSESLFLLAVEPNYPGLVQGTEYRMLSLIRTMGDPFPSSDGRN